MSSAPSPRGDPRGFLRALYDAAVARALPAHNTAHYLPPPPRGRTLVLGAGKAGGAMAAAVDALWPKDARLAGLVVTRYDHVPPTYKARPGRIEVVEAAQVVADEGRVSIERLTGAIASGAAIVEALAAKMPAEAKALSGMASRKAWVVTEVLDGFA